MCYVILNESSRPLALPAEAGLGRQDRPPLGFIFLSSLPGQLEINRGCRFPMSHCMTNTTRFPFASLYVYMPVVFMVRQASSVDNNVCAC